MVKRKIVWADAQIWGVPLGERFVHLGPRRSFSVVRYAHVRTHFPHVPKGGDYVCLHLTRRLMETHGITLRDAPIKCPDFTAGQGAVVNADFVNLAAEERVNHRIVRSGSYHKVLVRRCNARIHVESSSAPEFSIQVNSHFLIGVHPGYLIPTAGRRGVGSMERRRACR